MSSRIEFITRGVKIMAKRITKKPAKKPATKRAITKKPNTNNKRKTTALQRPKPTRKQVSQAVKKINLEGPKKLNALKNAPIKKTAKKQLDLGCPEKLQAVGALVLGGGSF